MEAATKPGAVRTDPVRRQGRVRRLATETKQAFKTTEFWGMVGVIVAILVSAAVIKGGDTDGTDEFIARQAWLYVAIVAGAYFIGRGLAKSGSSDPYTENLETAIGTVTELRSLLPAGVLTGPRPGYSERKREGKRCSRSGSDLGNAHRCASCPAAFSGRSSSRLRSRSC